jgi:hypothetical protein
MLLDVSPTGEAAADEIVGIVTVDRTFQRLAANIFESEAV